MSCGQTPERVAWPFWCGLCSTAWGRYGFEPPGRSRCPKCLTVVSYIPPAEQLALFAPAEAEIPVYDSTDGNCQAYDGRTLRSLLDEYFREAD